MSVGDVAGLIAAIGFVLLVGFIAYPLVKLGQVLDETRLTVRGLSEGALPLGLLEASLAEWSNEQGTARAYS